MNSIKLFIAALLISTSCLASAANGQAPASIEKLNINQATVEQLAQRMNGIGLNKAKAIVTYREQHGGFTSLDELVEVKGIGKSTLNKNRAILKLK